MDRRLLLIAAPFLLSVPGCSDQPQVARDNRRLVHALLTAVSAKNEAWLDASSVEIEKRRAEGRMSDGEHRAFREIIGEALAGKWEEATDRAYRLRGAQRTTREDIERIRHRPIDHEHPVPKAGRRTGRPM